MTLKILEEHWINESTFGQIERIVIVRHEGTLLSIGAAATRLEILVFVRNHKEAFVYQWLTGKMHFGKRKMHVQSIGTHDPIRSFGKA
jgi:hypothetical protein